MPKKFVSVLGSFHMYAKSSVNRSKMKVMHVKIQNKDKLYIVHNNEPLNCYKT